MPVPQEQPQVARRREREANNPRNLSKVQLADEVGILRMTANFVRYARPLGPFRKIWGTSEATTSDSSRVSSSWAIAHLDDLTGLIFLTIILTFVDKDVYALFRLRQ